MTDTDGASLPEAPCAAAQDVTARAKALIGRVLGNAYRLESVLATTVQCAVFRASHLTLGRPAAVKVLLWRGADEEQAKQRFLREARAAAGVKHPAFVAIFDCSVTDDGLPYFAMEMLEGETLQARFKRQGRLPPDEAAAIGVEVASALAALHAEGWVHRDVKPSNLFMLAEPYAGHRLKLLDLGIVHRTRVESGAQLSLTRDGKGPTLRTLAGVIMGTPRYLSPEQVLGEPLDGRADLYALGAVLYEALTGTPPFHRGPVLALLSAHVNDVPEPISQRAPELGVPMALQRVVMRALEKEPAQRLRSATEMAAALRDSVAGVELPDDDVPAPSPIVGRLAPALLGGAVMIAAVASAALWWMNH